MSIETGTHSQSEASAQKPRTTLMVLGKNIGEEWTGDRIRRTHHHLSPHSRIGVLATGIAIKNGLTDEAVFTITNTAGSAPLTEEEGLQSRDIAGIGKPLPPEAELMATHFKRIFPKLADRVRVQPNSWDTNTDAKEAKKLIEEKQIDPDNRFILASIGFHLDRARDLFKRQKIKFTTLATEDLLALRRPGFVEAYKKSPLYQAEVKKEKRIRFIQRLPFAADFITAITKRSRTK